VGELQLVARRIAYEHVNADMYNDV